MDNNPHINKVKLPILIREVKEVVEFIKEMEAAAQLQQLQTSPPIFQKFQLQKAL